MRDFLKWMAASAIGTLIGLMAFGAMVGVGVVGLLTYVIFTASQEPEPKLKPQSLLVVDLSTQIQDAVPLTGASVILEEALSGNENREISIYQALMALQQAAKDDHIAGLYLHGSSTEGLATLGELRTALEAFKASGKPIIAYNVGWSERDYYLTSIADTLVLDAGGLLELNGLQAETQFIAGALQKYGVGVQVLQAGRYKSAIEPFIRTQSSEANQEQIQALLTDLWQTVLTTVSSDRPLSVAQLQQLANQGGLLLATEAQQASLVDQVGYYDDVLADLQAITGVEPEVGEDLPAIDWLSYSRLMHQQTASSASPEIAVVYAAGEIVLGEAERGLIGTESLSRTLRDLRLDEDVKAVVLRINSPGGGATAAEILTDAVQRLQAEKPVVVSMGEMAASGGYMMAAPADSILASPTTITGSIGVFGLLLNFQEIANRNGITWDVEKTAPFADIDTLTRPQTPAELSLQQAIVDDLYERFVTLVAESRGLSRTAVEAVAQGRIWSGQDALAAGLVDELGGLEAAIAHAAEQANLSSWQVREYPRPQSLESQIFESFFGQWLHRLVEKQHPLLAELEQLQTTVEHLQTLDDPYHTYTRLPFTTEIQ